MVFGKASTTIKSTAVTAIATLAVAFFFQEALFSSISTFGVVDPFAYFLFSYKAPLSIANLSAVPSDPSCMTLRSEFPAIVHLPGDGQYNTPLDTYWSAKAQSTLPSCVVKPVNVQELANVVKHLKARYDLQTSLAENTPDYHTSDKVRFVVRSGGHMPEVGFASIDGGVLIDLRELSGVTVAPDRTTATIAAGSRWGPVYEKLESLGLSVVGGRDGHVGVGGLSLGGGISFLSPQVGMVSDNILEYEIVLADGRITTASSDENADIWRALKGGAGNFGIVTKITAKTFPSTKIWAGYVYWPAGQAKKLLRELHEFVKPKNFDRFAAGPILGFGYIKLGGFSMHAAASSVVYTKPEAWPSVWQGFKRVLRVWSTVRVTTLPDAAQELTSMSPSGKRQFQVTMTVKNDLETLESLHDIYSKSIEKIKHVQGVGRALVYQPLTPKIIHKGTPNVLGLESRNASDPLIIVLVTQAWQLEQDDEIVESTTRELLSDMQTYARAKGTLDRYIYLNYAASHQDVFASYGEENKRFLNEVSRKYDPDGFWQHARHGGHKLERFVEAV